MDKRAGVYILKDIHSGGEYVGSSKNIKDRVYKHFYRLGRGTHHNAYLQNVYNLGRPLVAGALYYCSVKEMRYKEQEEIDKRNPKYNLKRNVHHQHFGGEHAQSKTYKVINPQGEVFIIDGIVKFLEDNKMSSSSFYKVLNGELYQYFGWRKYDESEIGIKITPRAYRALPLLLSPSGDVFKVENSIRGFCKDKNLDYTTLYKVVNGEAYQHKGWRLYDKNEEGKEYTKPSSIFYILENGENDIVQGTARQLTRLGFNAQSLCNLTKGRQKTHKNYKLKDHYKVCQNQ